MIANTRTHLNNSQNPITHTINTDVKGRLVGISQAAHTGHNTEDVVVDGVADEVPGGWGANKVGAAW